MRSFVRIRSSSNRQYSAPNVAALRLYCRKPFRHIQFFSCARTSCAPPLAPGRRARNLNVWELMMRRNSLARISIVGILIQLMICMPAAAANLKASATKRINGVVKDALGRPLKDAARTLQASNGYVVAHSSSNDAGEFSFNAITRGTYAVVATKQGYKPATAIVSVSAKGASPVTVAMEAEQS